MISVNECRWYLYAYPNETDLIPAIAGVVSLVLSSLLLLVIFRLPRMPCCSAYVIMGVLGTACWFRSLLTILVHAMVPVFYSGVTLELCAATGFLHKLASSYQLEAITALCIERYVSAKYHMLRFPMDRRAISIICFCCWIFTLFYAVTPLFGFGVYLINRVDLGVEEGPNGIGHLWALSEPRCDTILYKATLLVLELMQSVKPVVLISYMLYWTYEIEKECYTGASKQDQLVITKSVSRVTLISALCWTPTFISYLWSIMQPTSKCPPDDPPATLVMWSSLGLEIAPAATIIAIFATNEDIRSNFFKLFRKNQICDKTE